MENSLKIIEAGLRERDKLKIGLKWPLSEVKVYIKGRENFSEFETMIKNQLNVKKITLQTPASKGTEFALELNTKVSKDLEAEGYARELSRQVQDFRKKLGLKKENLIKLYIITNLEFVKVLEDKKAFIKERTNAKTLDITTTPKETFKNKMSFSIKDKRGEIAIIVTNR